MSERAMRTRKSWFIDASGPPEGPHKWRARIQVCVLAPNVYEALAGFRASYPNAEVWNVKHEGQRLILDPDVPAQGDS